MNRKGHLIFAMAIAIIVLYFLTLSQYIIFSKKLLLILVIHSPIYFFGSLILDKLEKSGQKLINHRKFFHSKRILFLSIVLAPFLLYLSVITPPILFSVANYYSMILAMIFGIITHLLGDSLTSRLPR